MASFNYYSNKEKKGSGKKKTIIVVVGNCGVVSDTIIYV